MILKLLTFIMKKDILQCVKNAILTNNLENINKQ